MYVNVSKHIHKHITYYAVRIFKTYYQNGKKINKIVKTIGNTTNPNEVEKLKKNAWDYILETQKDIRLSLSEIKGIRPQFPTGLMRTIEKIFSNLGVLQHMKKNFPNNYDEFLEEIAYRFY